MSSGSSSATRAGQDFCPRRNQFFPLRRRDLLQLGGVGASLSLLPKSPWQSSLAAAERVPPRPNARAKSVLVLWMAGGVTHFESFDPKPTAPEEVRGTLSPIATGIPGVHFAEVMPKMALCTNLYSLVRSYSHDNNDHFMSQAWALSGRPVPLNQILTEPNVGSIVSYLHGPRGDMPGYLAVPGWTRPGPPPTNLFVGGWLGNEYAPFSVGGEPPEPDFTVGVDRWERPPEFSGETIRPDALSLPAGMDLDRIDQRGSLRQLFDGALRLSESRELRSPAPGVMDEQYSAAMEMLRSPVLRKAFEVQDESEQTRQAYGRTKIGGRCLLARRLLEADARFVMVDYGYDPDYGNLWDNHAVPTQKQPHICELAKRSYHLAGVDQACAALLADMSSRGLLEHTLVVFLTEFGRTPRINSGGGRDHWGPAGSIFFAGAGVRGGQVIGQTDKQGAYPTTRGYKPSDVAATIYDALGIDFERRIVDKEGRPQAILPEGEPIRELFG